MVLAFYLNVLLMKKSSLVLFFLSIIIIGCNNDDDSNNTIPVSLIGFWIPTTIVVEGERISYDDHEDCGFDTLRFTNDFEGYYTDIFQCEEIQTVFEYSITGEIIEIQFGNLTQTGSILSISEEILRLQFEYDFDDDGDIETVIENYERGFIIPNE